MMDEALKVYNEYFRKGRGAHGGLVAATRDVIILTEMVHRAQNMLMVAHGVVEDAAQGEPETASHKEAKRYYDAVGKWLADYNTIAGIAPTEDK